MNEAERFLKEQLAKAQGARGTFSQTHEQSYEPTVTPMPPRASFDTYRQLSTEPQFIGRQYCVTFGEAIKRYWTNWSLNGRASRSEYWFAILGLFLITLLVGILCILSFFLGARVDSLVWIVWSLVTTWPSFAIRVRRLHDLGKTMLLALVVAILSLLLPFMRLFPIEVVRILGLSYLIMRIWLFCCMLCRSQMDENSYGPVPNLKR